jgi:hypothetical protein
MEQSSLNQGENGQNIAAYHVRPCALVINEKRRSRASHLCRLSFALSGGIALAIAILCYSTSSSQSSVSPASSLSLVELAQQQREQLFSSQQQREELFLSGAQARNELRNYWKSFDEVTRNPRKGKSKTMHTHTHSHTHTPRYTCKYAMPCREGNGNPFSSFFPVCVPQIDKNPLSFNDQYVLAHIIFPSFIF